MSDLETSTSFFPFCYIKRTKIDNFKFEEMKFFTGIIAYKKTGNNGTTPSPAILNLVILLHGLYEDL